MATFTPFEAFIEALAEGKHNLGADTLKVALTTNANVPTAASDAVLADITAVSLTNLADATVSVTSSSQTSGTYTLALTDKTLTASGGAIPTFRHIVIYNDTATNDDLIGMIDCGSDIDLADTETFDIDFAASTITIGPAA